MFALLLTVHVVSFSLQAAEEEDERLASFESDAADGADGSGDPSAARVGGAEALRYARMAAAAQAELESQALPFLSRLKEATGATRLCFAGGESPEKHCIDL